MTLWEYIKNDHHHIETIFQEIGNSTDGGTGSRERLFAQLKQALDQHTGMEEDIFYPALRQYRETQGFVDEALREHDEAKQMLQRLGEASEDSPQWMQQCQDLQRAVMHHVREEEQDIFPVAKGVIHEQQANELMRRMQRDKAEMIEQAHA